MGDNRGKPWLIPHKYPEASLGDESWVSNDLRWAYGALASW